MSSFSTLRKSLLLFHRFNSQSSVTFPSITSSVFRFSPKWVSAIVVGSTISLLYWFSTKPNSTHTPTFSNPLFFSKLSLPQSSYTSLLSDGYRRKVFFNYEKRIRLHSPPEKVFEYFASCRSPEGELLMRPTDLMRAIVPVFPPSESNIVKDGYLQGERSPGHLHCPPSQLFMLFDVNTDDLISFKEEIDKEEFKKVMALMRSHNRQGVQHRNGLRTGLKVNGSVENGGLVEYFFGKDGKGCLSHDKFIKFMRDLHDEVLRLEFAHYDYKSRNTISAKDFAFSMVASADMSHLGRLLERVEELDNDPRFRDVRITFEEFKKFAELRKNLLPFSFALFSFAKVNNTLTKDDFQRAASHVCDLSLSNNVVEIVFHLFDTNGDGNLSSDEFVRVLHKREKDIAQPVGSRILGLLSCRWELH
ncbi:PREDICTED: calcium uptake protein 1, mitochondrial isoform X2 [Lupinus angustifolius]|uniref:calcium uptake protein 1, mitochondrial isoform X2 n=1 Tax=Lupinus angustifolius TaxID=3871 RepID=UPI00092F8CA6|nr:PREDICTED: calcium uptake protein 1, mitochondrial isoform X2 [Lupinus angustifolius]